MLAGKPRQQRGFTLLELMLSLLIAAIIAVMVVPAFTTFLARQQLASDVNEMISLLSFARSEAIKQRRDISVIFSPPGTATANRRPTACRNSETIEGASQGNDDATRYLYSGWCYWVAVNDAGNEILRIGQAANITAPDRSFALTFQSLGDADIDDCHSTACRIQISPVRANNTLDAIELTIRTTGSIRRQAP